MPTLDVSLKDVSRLAGRKITARQMEDYVLYAKGELEKVEGDRLKIDIKDTNRPDLWSAEGIAREIRLKSKGGLRAYEIMPSGLVVNVEKSVSKVRPLTVCAVIKGLRITEETLAQMIQLQEKVAMTFGRKRKEAAIGVYDYDIIKGPITYKGVKPTEIRFTPLESNVPMTPKQILRDHPKGREYGSLLEKEKLYPMFIDSAGEVLSMPPIINSNYSGKVDTSTKNLFIEVSGFDLKFLMPALNVMVAALADRGGKVCTVKIKYGSKTMTTPDLKPKKARIDADFIRKIAGMDMKASEIKSLLEKAGYSAKPNGKHFEVHYPAYRQDIMHPVDIVEDVLISYGYNNMEPEKINLVSIGKVDRKEAFSKDVREIMIGLGGQEVMTFTLTNKESLFGMMNAKPVDIVEIENPVSSRWVTLRNWLTPSVMGFLSENTNKKYPQHVFEVGDVVELDKKAETQTATKRKVAYYEARNEVNFTELKQKLDVLMKYLGAKTDLRKSNHGSFIPGRCAEIMLKGKSIGIIGEIHPQVLENWKIEMPIAGFEIDLEEIMRLPHPAEQVV